MGRLILILGGARSGKSSLAEKMARQWGGRVTYVATAQPLDEEMRLRIENHQAGRPREWRTLEEPLNLAEAVQTAASGSDVVVVDCLTLWLSNHLCRIEAPESSPQWHAALEDLTGLLERSVDRLLESVRSSDASVLLVSNEVGLGLVPPAPLGRAYRDLLGMVNRLLAAEADQVLLMVAGLAVDVKRLAEGGYDGYEHAPGVGVAFVPCTCGELVQGTLEGEPFLVSCPIDRYSRVKVLLTGEHPAGSVPTPRRRGAERGWETQNGVAVKRSGDSTAPTDPNFKARAAAVATLALLGYPEIPFTLEVACPLPPSKGFGTSTADVVGAVAAAAAAVGTTLDPAEIARLAVAIEPSDSTMFPGLAFFNHRTARRWEVMGGCPPLAMAVLEFEGDVDTLDYNARLDLELLRSMEPDHAAAIDLLGRGVRSGRPELIGRAATASARINQRLLPKPELEGVISLGERFGALGVCVAHSGTAMGVIFRPEETRAAQGLLAVAGERLKGVRAGSLARMVGGGASAQREDRTPTGHFCRKGVPQLWER